MAQKVTKDEEEILQDPAGDELPPPRIGRWFRQLVAPRPPEAHPEEPALDR